MTDELQNFLEVNLPKLKKRKVQKFSVGVVDPKLGSHIHQLTSIPCQSNDFVFEMLCGVRLHIDWFLKSLKPRYLEKVQLGLGHSYSREKVKFNVMRADNMVIHAIRHPDTLSKDVNTFSRRIREWYSCHFPELADIVNDDYLYAKVAEYVANKTELSTDKIPGLVDLVGDEKKASEIIKAAKVSMGQDLSHFDLIHVKLLAQRVMVLVEERKKLNDYMVAKMSDVAPALAALVGEVIGARLISHAGSLMNLAKLPSTIQILGAEKSLLC
ncbi:nucleolar protein 56-like [Apium graveolens]|uniref:nucleolar protein 56-like n=1 Tax=Apium graveolens TaxID=4045 RepID=UPI003D78D242